MSNQPSIHKAQLKDFSADTGNANLHTELGEKMLAKAISQRGIARPILATSDGVIIAGDLTKKTIEEAGYQEALVIETDGTIPIIHVRKDLPDSSDLKARTLAIEDNRIAQVSLNWNDAELLQAKQIGVNMAELFSTPAAVRSIAGILHSVDEQAEEDVEDIGKTVQVLAPTPSLVDYISIGQTNIPITPDEVSGLSLLYERYTAAVGVHAGFLMWLLQDWEEE